MDALLDVARTPRTNLLLSNAARTTFERHQRDRTYRYVGAIKLNVFSCQTSNVLFLSNLFSHGDKQSGDFMACRGLFFLMCTNEQVAHKSAPCLGKSGLRILESLCSCCSSDQNTHLKRVCSFISLPPVEYIFRQVPPPQKKNPTKTRTKQANKNEVWTVHH